VGPSGTDNVSPQAIDAAPLARQRREPSCLVLEMLLDAKHRFVRRALARDLNRCIELGGNIYFLAKIGATDGKSFQQMAASMTGMSEQEYRDMMLAGGRSVEGNRSKSGKGKAAGSKSKSSAKRK
jgi:protocatechuate 4,5-dioxygenase alpha subunit